MFTLVNISGQLIKCPVSMQFDPEPQTHFSLFQTPVKVPSRLNQIKLEECINQGEREVAHERFDLLSFSVT